MKTYGILPMYHLHGIYIYVTHSLYVQKGSQITKRHGGSYDSYAPWWNVTRLLNQYMQSQIQKRNRCQSCQNAGQTVKHLFFYNATRLLPSIWNTILNLFTAKWTWEVDEFVPFKSFGRLAWTRPVTWWRHFEHLHPNLNQNSEMKPENRLTSDAYDIIWHPTTRHNSIGCRHMLHCVQGVGEAQDSRQMYV